jgi:hypothetical protein
MDGDRWAGHTSNQKGAIAEAAITAHAIRAGAQVLRPLIEGERYDLVFGVGSSFLRVQCKWGIRIGEVVSAHLQTSCRVTGGGHVHRSYTEDEIDAIAVHCAAIDRSYLLPISLVARRKQIHLRLFPARNNQRRKLHLAEEYELAGAIAQLGERVTGSHEVAGSSPASST